MSNNTYCKITGFSCKMPSFREPQDFGFRTSDSEDIDNLFERDNVKRLDTLYGLYIESQNTRLTVSSGNVDDARKRKEKIMVKRLEESRGKILRSQGSLELDVELDSDLNLCLLYKPEGENGWVKYQPPKRNNLKGSIFDPVSYNRPVRD